MHGRSRGRLLKKHEGRTLSGLYLLRAKLYIWMIIEKDGTCGMIDKINGWLDTLAGWLGIAPQPKPIPIPVRRPPPEGKGRR